jgi:iron complex outermembrane receptor protein
VSSVGVLGNFKGTPFPFSPKWTSVTDVSYTHALNDVYDAFAGCTATYNSATNSGIGAPAILAIDSYTLLDLRAGLETKDGRYRLTFWGKNVTDKYHWSSSFLGFDTISRFVGDPATYGVRFSYRYQ